MSKEKSCIFGETPSVENNRESLIRRRIQKNNVKVGTKKGVNNNRNQQYRNKGNLHSNKLVKKGDLEK